ncbi:MAG: hypothetical protein EPN97_02570 [Alphaproteobacteria bacterium]|nr:MAG: hypothetical protein EPN97_02570 [Alphaproteobacteria bacterium]
MNPIADPNKDAAGTLSRFQTPAPGDYAVRATKDGDIATVRLDHAPGATGKVALFLPKGFDPSRPAVIMPYFHGHGGGIDDALNRQKLTEQAAKSGKNIAFVIPQLGEKSEIKDAFRKPEYAAKFLDEAAGALSKLYTQTHPGADAEKVSQSFKDMPIVPLTYSGGYQATWPTLKDPRVKGVVALDSMYSSAKPFIDFSRRADEPFVSVTVGPSTKGHVDEFEKASMKGNTVVTPMKGGHGELVQSALGGVLETISIEADGRPSLAAGATEKQVLASLRSPKPG